MSGLLGHISQRDREYFEDHGEWCPKPKDSGKISKVHNLCKRCKNFVDSAETAYDCYSKRCPSTNKHIKVDGFGPDRTRKPTWTPCE